MDEFSEYFGRGGGRVGVISNLKHIVAICLLSKRQYRSLISGKKHRKGGLEEFSFDLKDLVANLVLVQLVCHEFLKKLQHLFPENGAGEGV